VDVPISPCQLEEFGSQEDLQENLKVPVDSSGPSARSSMHRTTPIQSLINAAPSTLTPLNSSRHRPAGPPSCPDDRTVSNSVLNSLSTAPAGHRPWGPGDDAEPPLAYSEHCEIGPESREGVTVSVRNWPCSAASRFSRYPISVSDAWKECMVYSS
jgi:hypothetical protein